MAQALLLHERGGPDDLARQLGNPAVALKEKDYERRD